MIGFLRQRWTEKIEWHASLWGAVAMPALAHMFPNRRETLIKLGLVAIVATMLYLLTDAHAARAGITGASTCSALGQNNSPGPLGQALATFQSGSANWPTNGADAVRDTFLALLLIQLITDVVKFFLERGGSVEGILGSFSSTYFVMAITAGLFFAVPAWIVPFFQWISTTVVGATTGSPPPNYGEIYSSTFSPGGFATEGLCVALSMSSTLDSQIASWWNNPVAAIHALLLSAQLWPIQIVVALAYVAISIYFTVTALEIYVVAGVGSISLAGMGHRTFHSLPLTWMMSLFGLGVKLAGLGCIAIWGLGIADTFENQVANATDPGTMIATDFSVMLGAFMFGAIGVVAPSVIGSHFKGSAFASQAQQKGEQAVTVAARSGAGAATGGAGGAAGGAASGAGGAAGGGSGGGGSAARPSVRQGSAQAPP